MADATTTAETSITRRNETVIRAAAQSRLPQVFKAARGSTMEAAKSLPMS
jgi:hypothetical protein